MRQIVWCALACTMCTGCASSSRYGRLDSYRALPLDPEEFQAAEQYTAFLVEKPFALHVSERGSAWLLLVRRADGKIDQFVAVEFDHAIPPGAEQCPATVGRLIAIAPGDPRRYEAARGILVSHDGERCFSGTAAFRCAERDAWQHVESLERIAVTHRRGDPSDEKLREWYADRLRNEMIRTEHTTLDAAAWRRIRWETSVRKKAVDASPPAVGGGVAAGVLATPVVGLIVGGVAFAVRFPQLLFDRDHGPEYGDEPMPAAAVAEYAEYLRRCGHGHEIRTAKVE